MTPPPRVAAPDIDTPPQRSLADAVRPAAITIASAHRCDHYYFEETCVEDPTCEWRVRAQVCAERA